MADDKDGDSQLNNDRRPQDPPFIRVGATFASPDDEHSYGLGQNQEVYLDHRQHKVECWADYQSAGGPNLCVPFLVTNKGYGLIWDNPSKTTILPGFNEQTKWISQVGLRVSFFIIAGASTDEIYAGYRLLTGDTPMLPKWAYGLIQCKQRTTIQNYMYGGMNMACFNRTSEHTGRAHRTKYGLTAVRQSQSLRSIYGCGIRGGSIIPLGSAVESTHDKQTIEHVKVFPGADGEFALYRDDGLTYAYEKGESQTTKIHWDDKVRRLTQSGPPAWSGDSIVEVVGKP